MSLFFCMFFCVLFFVFFVFFFFFSSRRRHTRSLCDWSSDVCSSDLVARLFGCEVANASMYDGSTAMWEAILMAHRITRRRSEERRVGKECRSRWSRDQ